MLFAKVPMRSLSGAPATFAETSIALGIVIWEADAMQ
jgi:hypothetical protein